MRKKSGGDNTMGGGFNSAAHGIELSYSPKLLCCKSIAMIANIVMRCKDMGLLLCQ
jgi:hypothetical protein